MKGKRKLLIAIIALGVIAGATVFIVNRIKLGESQIAILGNSKENRKDSGGEERAISGKSWKISADENSNVTATLDSTGVLSIYGTGAMKNWGYENEVDWYEDKDQIKKVEISSGVTTIGDYAFSNCERIVGTISIPSTIVSIGKSAFEESSISGDLTIPDSVVSIGKYAFRGCDTLYRKFSNRKQIRRD